MRVRQLGLELLDLVDHAVLGGALAGQLAGRQFGEAEAGRVQVGLIDLDVGEVPRRRLPVAVAVVVSPHRPAGEVRLRQCVGVGGQEAVHLLARHWRQVVVGDHGHDLVAEGAPGGGWQRKGGADERGERNGLDGQALGPGLG